MSSRVDPQSKQLGCYLRLYVAVQLPEALADLGITHHILGSHDTEHLQHLGQVPLPILTTSHLHHDGLHGEKISYVILVVPDAVKPRFQNDVNPP
eukprot:CAMPEP_0114165618 /NCGR_PEP_ID=MMETSP0043_2-20121206/31358_1 /TAXON_ID=464988 /ORGANISM="Hemiselmis andersenii, Strain CCMP644" /LENGTH=94 /DNA_ID=CAMNT_0001262479 /DNA_START=175 /DNA_END=455 /DNA_ORIENTATION=-